MFGPVSRPGFVPWVCLRLISAPPCAPERGRVPTRTEGGVGPIRVTPELHEDRQPSPLAHREVPAPPREVSTLFPAPPFLGPGGQLQPAGQGGTHAAGVRNLGPEPHKAGAAFTAWLCCQLPMTQLLKLPLSPHIPFMASCYAPAP